jgi:hypothetical protein
MCPKCSGPTVQRALFTSFYDHCERCDAMPVPAPAIAQASTNPCAEIDLGQAPFSPGDTVYRTNGAFTTRARLVEQVFKRSIRTRGKISEQWLVKFVGENGHRDCNAFTKDAPKQADQAA